MTKKPKKKIRHYERLLAEEVKYMNETLKYVDGPTGSDQKGPIFPIPYVQLATVLRQIDYRKIIRKTYREMNKMKVKK